MHARADCTVTRTAVCFSESGAKTKTKETKLKGRSLSYLRNWFRQKQNQRVQSDRVVYGQDMEELTQALQSSAEAG
jgi:hypothetical protein